MGAHLLKSLCIYQGTTVPSLVLWTTLSQFAALKIAITDWTKCCFSRIYCLGHRDYLGEYTIYAWGGIMRMVEQIIGELF